MRYEKPELRELGSLAELTEQEMNKIGRTPDIYTAITQGVVVGSRAQTSARRRSATRRQAAKPRPASNKT